MLGQRFEASEHLEALIALSAHSSYWRAPILPGEVHVDHVYWIDLELAAGEGFSDAPSWLGRRGVAVPARFP